VKKIQTCGGTFEKGGGGREKGVKTILTAILTGEGSESDVRSASLRAPHSPPPSNLPPHSLSACGLCVHAACAHACMPMPVKKALVLSLRTPLGMRAPVIGEHE
jgi:hypothetical protein